MIYKTTRRKLSVSLFPAILSSGMWIRALLIELGHSHVTRQNPDLSLSGSDTQPLFTSVTKYNGKAQELAEQTTVDVLKISFVSLACKEDEGCTSESVKARVLQDMKSRINIA